MTRRLVVAGVVLHLAVGAAGAEPTPPARVHEIVVGDTLGAIAKRYGVTVAALVAENRLASARVTLKIGRRLTIPAAAREAPKRVPASGPRAPGDVVLAVPEFVESAHGFAWPVEGPVTSTFGRRRGGWHRGIDIKAEQGTAVLAAAPGMVIVSGVEPRYGRVVKLEHDGGFVTVYAHNDENLVEVGYRVATGERLAAVGRTGRATTHHVHFEVRRQGRVYNPLYLLPLPPRVAQVEENGEPENDDE